jgi:glycosyltransferase involved in cell wall biosynthesis
MSGIGHTLLNLLTVMANEENQKRVSLTLIAPIDKMSILKERTKGMSVKYRSIPIPAKFFYGLMKYNITPPLDLYFGQGVYLFPNFRNWRLARSVSVTYIHDLAFKIFPQYVAPKNQKFLERNTPGWLKQTNRIVAVSKCTKKDIIEYYKYPENHIKVIYNGINLDEFYPRPLSEITAVKEKYSIKGKYLIFLSTIEPRKNVLTLLEAYGQLPREYLETYSLVLVGSNGWLNDGIVDQIQLMQETGYSIIWPQTFVPDEDLPSLLSGAEILIHPAYYEGFGISPLQAMSCGTPVVVADNSSLPEVVGDTGLYFKTTDVRDLKEKIVYALSDSRSMHKLGEQGRQRARYFTWAVAGKSLVDYILLLSHHLEMNQ